LSVRVEHKYVQLAQDVFKFIS